MEFRVATSADISILAQLNHELIHDEGHRNRMADSDLKRRMKEWLSADYTAILFEDQHEVVAYALFRPADTGIYLRQFFVVRHRRREGLGRQAMQTLRSKIWPKDTRLTVDVLVGNEVALAFWRAMGYRDYCLTLEILPEGR